MKYQSQVSVEHVLRLSDEEMGRLIQCLRFAYWRAEGTEEVERQADILLGHLSRSIDSRLYDELCGRYDYEEPAEQK